MVDLGSIFVSMKLNIEEFSDGMKSIQDSVKETESKLSGLEKTGETFTKTGQKLTLGLTVPIVAAGASAINFASDFELGMTKISTIADTTQVPIDDLKKSIVDLSNDSGESTEALTEALYDALSSGVQTADAMDFLTVAVKSAKGGFTDSGTAIDGLTTLLNAYGLETSNAIDLSNQMMIAQDLGKVFCPATKKLVA